MGQISYAAELQLGGEAVGASCHISGKVATGASCHSVAAAAAGSYFSIAVGVNVTDGKIAKDTLRLLLALADPASAGLLVALNR